ncbi:DUF4403 family protein [Verrucomicrobiales bacterium]|jgi:hypothetical protein|nr:DUF4403 family protein [Verrucomicrobiales bacterium]
MKKILLILGVLFVAGLILIPVTTLFIGPKMIRVSPPSGEPIGKFDVLRPEKSIFALKIAIPLKMLSEAANSQAPERLQGSEQKSIHKRIKNGAYAWDVKRGEIQFQNQGDGLTFGAPIGGAARISGSIDAKIIQIPLNSTVELGGVVGGKLNPVIAPDWKVNPNLVPHLSLSKANLNIGGLGKIDVTDLLGSSLSGFVQKEAAKLTPAFKKKFDLKGEVEKLWLEAYINELISDEPSVWLNVDPRVVFLSPIDYSNPEILGVSVAIQAETFLTNREPAAPAPIPLPNLQPLEPGTRTDLRVPLIVSMKELNKVLKTEDIEIKTGLGTKITISGIEAQVGQNGLVNLKINIKTGKTPLSRGVSGEIWMKARPIIDYEKQTLGFSDVELTVETRDQLTSTAAWLVEELLVKGIESQLRIDLNDYKEKLDEEVQQAIQSAKLPEGINVSLDGLTIKLADIYTITRHSPEDAPDPGIVLVIRATGDVSTEISQLDLGKKDKDDATTTPAKPK